MPVAMDQLDREWARLVRSPRARRHLRRWAAEYPALAGLGDLDGVLERRRDPDQAQPVLLALAALAPVDEVAARTLLEALMPGINRLAQNEGFGDPNVVEDMLGTAWMLIRAYPGHRQGSVAANVLLDLRKRYRRDHRAFESLRDEPPVVAGDWAAPSAEDEALGVIAVAELVEAMRRHDFDDDTIRLVVRTRVERQPLTAFAAEAGIPYRRLVMRRIRAEQRIRALALAG